MHRIIEVIKEGKSTIYDNFHPNGIPRSDYMKSIEGFSRKKGIINGQQLLEKYSSIIN